MRRLGAEAIDNHSTLFSATLAHGAVESVVLADQGADTNLMPPSVYELIKKSGMAFQTTHLNPSHSFKAFDQISKVTCNKKVITDVHLRIRHGTNLVLRNLEWHVGDCETEYLILGRPVLEALGCNNRTLLAAACDRNNGVVNIPEALRKQQCDASEHGRISALLAEGVFHSAGGDENDGLSDEDVYIDLGDDSEQELDDALNLRINEAKDNGMSPAGVARLRKIISANKSIFA